MLNTDTPQVRVVEQMDELIGRGEWEAAAGHFTDGVVDKVANLKPVGIDEIRSCMAWQNSKVSWEGHHVRMKISEPDVVVMEVESHFRRQADDSPLVPPCTDVSRFDGLRIAERCVYADISAFE